MLIFIESFYAAVEICKKHTPMESPDYIYAFYLVRGSDSYVCLMFTLESGKLQIPVLQFFKSDRNHRDISDSLRQMKEN